MTRLWTFGCSLSSQIYPTWNELLSMKFSEHFNSARGGAGNRFIYTSLMARITAGQIKARDTVVVQWSSNHRWDTYDSGRWTCKGSIYHRDDLGPMFGPRYYTPVSATVDALTHAASASRILDAIGCDWYMCCLHDLDNPAMWDPSQALNRDNLVGMLAKDLGKWGGRWARKSIHQYCLDSGLDFKLWKKWCDRNEEHLDPHPTPMMAYTWLRYHLAPMMRVDVLDLEPEVKRWQAVHDGLESNSQIPDAYPEMMHRHHSNLKNAAFIGDENHTP